jgi:hypothetical protein
MPYGPPLRNAPWMVGFPRSSGNPRVAPSPPSPPLPPGHPSMNKPFLSRVPENEPRARRFFDVVSGIVNSLIGKGYLVETATGEFELRIPPTP